MILSTAGVGCSKGIRCDSNQVRRGARGRGRERGRERGRKGEGISRAATQYKQDKDKYGLPKSKLCPLRMEWPQLRIIFVSDDKAAKIITCTCTLAYVELEKKQCYGLLTHPTLSKEAVMAFNGRTNSVWDS